LEKIGDAFERLHRVHRPASVPALGNGAARDSVGLVTTHVVVLSDTHIRRGSSRRLPDAAYDALGRADAILHAGDVLVPELLHELAGLAPVHAVLGNNDHELVGVLPEERTVE